jgi:putative phosphoribosyl transferase
MQAPDRAEAGRRLGVLVAADPSLAARVDERRVVVGLPRGGVPVAAEVADALGAELDLVLVRKLGVPGHRELAMGALGERGTVVWNEELVRRMNISERHRARAVERGRAELDEQVRTLRGDRAALDVTGATVVVVDDGVATGATARAAAAVLRARGATWLVLAAPVGPPDFDGAPEFDATIIDDRPSGFIAVGQHYVDFAEVSDAAVLALLAGRRRP